MLDKLYLVCDLGPGDGGKGGVVHKLAETLRPAVILKCGGGQGSHGVVTDGGEHFSFSHWGCGTLSGIPTCITPRFTVIPHALINEGEALRHIGFSDPWSMLTVAPDALCATPFHGILSQLFELRRKDRPRGTIGTGAGVALRMANACGEGYALRFHELWNEKTLRRKLERIAERMAEEAEPLRGADYLPADRSRVQALYDLIDDRAGYLEWTMEQYRALTRTGIRTEALPDVLQRYGGCAVAECSHGVLTDAEAGFKPHTSALRTLPQIHEAMVRGAGFTGRIVRLGVTRAYAVRHGAGPLPTADDAMVQQLLPGSAKEENRWQGRIRAGALDLNLLRYAMDACGGAETFDGLCVTWFDQIMRSSAWHLCDRYARFSGDYTTEALNRAEPVIETVPLPDGADRAALAQFCAETLRPRLGADVRMVGFGSAARDKLLI